MIVVEQPYGFVPLKTDVSNKEIDLIQAIISRMSNSQFKVKALCLAIIVLVCHNHFLTSMIAIVTCYYWDLKLLETERLYRKWFEFLMQKRPTTNEWLFELNPRKIAEIIEIPKVKPYTSWSLYHYIILAVTIFLSNSNISLKM